MTQFSKDIDAALASLRTPPIQSQSWIADNFIPAVVHLNVDDVFAICKHLDEHVEVLKNNVLRDLCDSVGNPLPHLIRRYDAEVLHISKLIIRIDSLKATCGLKE